MKSLEKGAFSPNESSIRCTTEHSPGPSAAQEQSSATATPQGAARAPERLTQALFDKNLSHSSAVSPIAAVSGSVVTSSSSTPLQQSSYEQQHSSAAYGPPYGPPQERRDVPTVLHMLHVTLDYVIYDGISFMRF